MHLLNSSLLSRRTFLRGGAVSLALPLLDAMIPSGFGATAARARAALDPQRLVLIHRPLGTYHPFYVPAATGLGYETTRFLEKLEPLRGRFTVFSGMGHVGYPNSHGTEPAIFTGVPTFNEKDLHNSISLDQVVAKRVGSLTRFPHLVLHDVWSQSLSWNEAGVPTPHERDMAALFRRMFLDGTPDEIRREMKRLQDGRSILDDVRAQMKALGGTLGAADRDRIEVMATSIREAEGYLAQDEAWAQKPKPKVDIKPETLAERDGNWVTAQQKWLTLVHLALQTDSTRVIVLALNEHGNANMPDISIAHHDASHHGKDPAKIEQLSRYEDKDFATFAEFLDKLAASREEGGTLLDKTQVLFTSNLGDASAHSSTNLPVLLAGGGYKHQGHIAFDGKENKPLSNLYVRMLRQMGVETDRFGSSDGVIGEIG